MRAQPTAAAVEKVPAAKAKAKAVAKAVAKVPGTPAVDTIAHDLDPTVERATRIVVEALKLPGRIKGGVAASSILDVHSLAVYRMVLAISVLFDVLHDYLPYAEEFLSDDAMVSACLCIAHGERVPLHSA